jgi:hypothetical protein
MSRRLRPSLLFAMAAAVACTGCQPTATGGVQEKARDTAKVFLQTCAENPLAAFDLLSEPAREDFFKGGTGFQGCRRILGFTPSRKESVRELFRGSRVESVERRGQDQFFTVTVKSPDGERADLDLELERDRFRISNPPTPSAEEKAREAATELLKDCADEDRAKVLDLLSDPARKDFLKAPSVLDGCAGILDVKKLPGEKPGEDKLRELFRDARVESLDRSLTDESFKATIEPPEGENLALELEPDPKRDSYLVA